MTPGSAGGKLGDHGALRRDEVIPLVAARCRRPTCPSRVPPIGFQPNRGRNLRSFGSVPFAAAQRSSGPPAPASSPAPHGPGSADGCCDCGSHVQPSHQPAAAPSATLKGNSLPAATCTVERLGARTPWCMPCVNILPSAVGWSQLQASKLW